MKSKGITGIVATPASNGHKVQITVRLDQDVLRWLRAHGPGWSTRLNALARRAMKRSEGRDARGGS